MIFMKIDFENKLWHIVLVRLLFEQPVKKQKK